MLTPRAWPAKIVPVKGQKMPLNARKLAAPTKNRLYPMVTSPLMLGTQSSYFTVWPPRTRVWRWVLRAVVGARRALALAAVACVLACRAEPAPVDRPEAAPSQAKAAAGSPTPVKATKADPSVSEPPATGGAAADAPRTGEAEPTGAGEPATPQEPYRVLLVGDSLIATGFGVLLEKRLDAHPHIRCFRRGKSASGLARPDFFDWMSEAKRQVKNRKPDLIVVVMGGNDGQDLTHKRKKSSRVRWKSEGWEAAYRERVDALTDVLLDGNQRKLLWLGLPFMDLRSLERKLVTIREVQQAAVAARGEMASYVDTTSLLGDGSEGLPEYVRVRKRKHKLRDDDGIHFTMSGSQYFADKVYPEVLRVLNLAPAED
ncbi:MAG: DUF459 domain-containing protein [Myxococcales bacterium FL481]|nr:MAG: DUF459 domain-containing protein [Myxococcales bacterium FL481]